MVLHAEKNKETIPLDPALLIQCRKVWKYAGPVAADCVAGQGILDGFDMDVLISVLSWKQPIVWFVACCSEGLLGICVLFSCPVFSWDSTLYPTHGYGKT